ncbi:hypothetical protein EI94DRAFT_1801735 [Lactarius quietus]|nr:hypothetical protein EI94DRAFT_1801735 [Lactarius quietus]
MAPGFFGLFSRRDSSKARRNAATSGSPLSTPKSPAGVPPTSTAKTSPSIAENSEKLEGSQLSLDTDYVLADIDSPSTPSTTSYPLASSSSTSGASSSTTKLKMPFRRKQSNSKKLSSTAQSSVPPVRPAKEDHKVSIESSLSDSPSLRPPPSRSAIFGSYADPHNALSTRSLPQDSPFPHSRQGSSDMTRHYETMSNPDSHMPSYSPLQPPKPSNKGGLFAWARPRGRTKSKPSIPTPPVTALPSRSSSALPSSAADSFNLKAFRHVTSPLSTSPNPDTSPLDYLDPPARPRPRGDSNASDSSQRISVAAFREVQARRSAANSPVPSSPGDRDSSLTSGQVRSRKRLSTLGTSPPLPNTASEPRPSVSRSPPTRITTAPPFLSASASSSDSSDEGDEESDEEEATLRPNRKRTVTSRSAGGTQSELGHRTSLVAAFSSARSDVGHGVHSGSPSRPALPPQPSKRVEVLGRTSRNSSVYSHKRGSVSASALVADAAGNRTSMISKHSAASKVTQRSQPTRTQSRASSSSEEESSSSSSSLSSEDEPLASLLPPPRPGSSTSGASKSPARRPTKPLIDIGTLVGENTAPPIRTPEPSRDSSQAVAKDDSPLMRPRKTSYGFGERLSAIASGISGSQPSRPLSPESTSDSKDEAFIPPTILVNPRPQSPALSTVTPPPPRSRTKSASPPLKPKGFKSSPGILRSPGVVRIDTTPLKYDSSYQPPPSSSASSDAPIPHITPTPIRERHDPPSFTVTSRPTSHASNPSVGTLAALDQAIEETNNRPSPRPAASGSADQARNGQQRQAQQQQQDPQATVRVVRSGPSKPAREESLPVPRPQQRSRVVSAGVTVSNIRVTPPPSSASSSPSMGRYGASSGPAMPLRKPFAIRDSSPASSAGESSSSRMPATPRDGSELGAGAGASGRLGPGPGHRKRVSVTFVDEIENGRETRSNVAGRSSHGGPVVAADSSDEETALRNRERKAEEKRKERRRTEAKAAIELGKVINGTGPIEDDDDDDGDEDEDEARPMNIPPRMSMAMGMGTNRNVPFPSAVPPMGLQGQWNPATGAQQPFANPLGSLSMQDLLSAGAGAGMGMGMGGGMNMPAGMNMGMGMGMGPGVGMVDPRMFVAHQQAMMIAKQTYQMAVAQQAMREAGDEWERGSAISGWGGGNRSSMATSTSVLGMGMNMNTNMGVNPFGMPQGAWPMGGGAGGSAARSMYAGSVYAASEAGGGMGWSTTNSVYGESFGAPRDRTSRGFRQSSAQQHGQGGGGNGAGSSGVPKREGARQRTRTAPSSGGGQLRAGAGPAASAAGGMKKRGEAPGLVGVVSPPSSWKGPGRS